MTWWEAALGILGGVVVVWLALIGLLWWASRRRSSSVGVKDALRLVPDVIGLVRRLIVDRRVPRGVRIALGALLVYLVLPIDLIPDVIPVLGYADDAIVVAVVLRFATRHAGSEALDRHWRGTAEGLESIRLFAGLAPSGVSSPPS
jgi:uncharacterized membrane protein YkvA (DUF1232 family)